MWSSKVATIQENSTLCYQIFDGDKILSFNDIIQLWINNSFFRNFYNALIADAPFDALFWEHPPMTKDTTNVPYEFVLVNSNSLSSVSPEAHTFKKYYLKGHSVVDFSNLRGDAQLVVPAPINATTNYAHLVKFSRNAPEEQIQDFWKRVGTVYQQQLSNQQLWLSTAGLGVYWLHIRMDSRPKYYKHGTYKIV